MGRQRHLDEHKRVLKIRKIKNKNGTFFSLCVKREEGGEGRGFPIFHYHYHYHYTTNRIKFQFSLFNFQRHELCPLPLLSIFPSKITVRPRPPIKVTINFHG